MNIQHIQQQVWDGNLTVENIRAVAAEIERRLNGKWLNVIVDNPSMSRPEIYPATRITRIRGRALNNEPMIHVWIKEDNTDAQIVIQTPERRYVFTAGIAHDDIWKIKFDGDAITFTNHYWGEYQRSQAYYFTAFELPESEPEPEHLHNFAPNWYEDIPHPVEFTKDNAQFCPECGVVLAYRFRGMSYLAPEAWAKLISPENFGKTPEKEG